MISIATVQHLDVSDFALPENPMYCLNISQNVLGKKDLEKFSRFLKWFLGFSGTPKSLTSKRWPAYIGNLVEKPPEFSLYSYYLQSLQILSPRKSARVSGYIKRLKTKI